MKSDSQLAISQRHRRWLAWVAILWVLLLMALMAWCRHHVIPNSTFAWWAAWLAAVPKTVYLPSQWLNKWTTRECGLSVPGWIELDVSGCVGAS